MSWTGVTDVGPLVNVSAPTRLEALGTAVTDWRPVHHVARVAGWEIRATSCQVVGGQLVLTFERPAGITVAGAQIDGQPMNIVGGQATIESWKVGGALGSTRDTSVSVTSVEFGPQAKARLLRILTDGAGQVTCELR